MKKRLIILLVSLGIVFGGIIAFNFTKHILIKHFFATFQPPPVSVSTVTAHVKDWQPRINAVGNFLAINGVEVNSQASGNVVKINFDSGQYVDKATPLIDIDDSSEQALLKFNLADKVLKEISFNRQNNLFKRGATAGSTLDEARASLEQAQANVEKIQAAINQKHIQAPFAGQLGIRQVNLGQYITPGQTSIVTLQSLDPLFLQFSLPEQMFTLLHIDQAIQFQLEAFPNLLFEGKITAINSKSDPNSHTLLVQATVPNCPKNVIDLGPKPSDKALKTPKLIRCSTEDNFKNKVTQFLFLPGMFASIGVEQQPIPNVVVIPSTAISYSLYGDTVYVVEKGKKDKKGNQALSVKRVFIVKGEQDGNDTVILRGIKAGDQVVSSGEIKLQNGAQVVINNSVMLNETNNPAALSH